MGCPNVRAGVKIWEKEPLEQPRVTQILTLSLVSNYNQWSSRWCVSTVPIVVLILIGLSLMSYPFSRFPSIRINPTVKKEDKRQRRPRQEGFPRCEGNIIPVTFGGSLDRWGGGGSKPGSASSVESGGGGGGGGRRSNTIVPALPQAQVDNDATDGRRRMSVASIKRSISSKVREKGIGKGARNSGSRQDDHSCSWVLRYRVFARTQSPPPPRPLPSACTASEATAGD